MHADDLLICNDISQILDSEIILYGTGAWGETVYECLKKTGKSVTAVCNTSERNSSFHNMKIMSLKQIRKSYDRQNVCIIITSINHWLAMISEYENLGFLHARLCTVYSFFISLQMHRDDMRIPDAFRNELWANFITSVRRFEYHNKLYALETLVQAAEAPLDTLLIYQPGKVGSRSVSGSLHKPCLHFHTLSVPYGCDEFDAALTDFYISKIRQKKTKIITLIREPIARDISAFFQGSETALWPFSSMNDHMFLWYGTYRGSSLRLTHDEIAARTPVWKKSLDDTFRKFAELIRTRKLDEFTWFDYELKDILGIDVYQYPFDKKQGYSLIRQNNTEVLILKLEKISSLESIIAQFADDPDFHISAANTGSHKLYSSAYDALKKNIRLNKSYFDYYYHANEKFRHFYSDDEISFFHGFWERHINSSL